MGKHLDAQVTGKIAKQTIVKTTIQKLCTELANWGLELTVNVKTCEVGGLSYQANSDITRLVKNFPPGKTLTKVLFVDESECE
jgi:hypothetical protein